MKEMMLLAWRNLWRNRRRTAITAASVFFAVFFAYIMRSFQLGSYDNMIINVVHSFSGFIQIHGEGYWDEKTLEQSFIPEEKLIATLNEDKRVSGYAPRLETFLLASSGNRTKGVMLTGIDPGKEDSLIGLRERLSEGSFLSLKSPGVMIGSRLTKYLNLRINDSLVLLGVGYHGNSAAGVFPVKAILKFPVPDLDSRMVFLDLPSAQQMLSADGRLTSLALNLFNPDDMDATLKALRTQTDAGLEVMDWREMMPELVQQIEVDNAEGIIMLGILYVIIGFGVLGTVLMMTNERRREFAMMIAVGMQKLRLIAIVWIELLFIALIGIISGLLFSLPILYYYYLHPYRLKGEMGQGIEQFGWEPVMPVAWESSYFISQSLVVFTIFLLVMLVPAVFIMRMKLEKSLKA